MRFRLFSLFGGGAFILLSVLLSGCNQSQSVLPTPIMPAALPAETRLIDTIANQGETAVSTPIPAPTENSITETSVSALMPLTLLIRAKFSAEAEIVDLALLDLTGGGLPDIVAAAQDQRVYVFMLDGVSFQQYFPERTSVVAGGDMDQDAIGDVFLGSLDQTVTVAEVDMLSRQFVVRGEPLRVMGEVTAVIPLIANNEPILVVGTSIGAVTGFDLALAQRWSVTLPTATAITHLLPLVIKPGDEFVMVGDSNGRLAALDSAGVFLWEQRLSGPITAIAEADLDQDNTPDLLASDQQGNVWAANGQGNELWRWSAGEQVNALVAIEDWGNGETAVLVGSGQTTGQLALLDKSGGLLWRADTGYPAVAVAAADLAGDGRLEFLAGTSSGDLLIFDGDGALRGRENLPAPITQLLIANLYDTPKPELLAVAGPAIYLLDAAPASTVAERPPTPDPAQLPTAAPTSQITAVSPQPTPMPALPLPDYWLDVDLDYATRAAAITQTVTVPNNSTDEWFNIVFHAAPAYWPGLLTLEETAVAVSGAPVTITPAISNTMIYLPLPAPLPPGETAEVQFRYTLNLPRLDPLGWGPVGNAGWNADLIQMGDWYLSLVPYDAGLHRWRTWEYVAVGDPVRSDLANFTVQISADPNVLIAAPGYVNTDGNTRRYRLENGRAFAFLASPKYTLLEGYSQNTPVRVYVLNEHQSVAPVVLNTAVQAINLYRNRFGVYPHNELIIAENGFLTAMEYSGIISLSGFAFREYAGSPRSLLTPITAHEVAHQYWYSAVGNDQVLEPWLDEALCMFAELLYFETHHPEDVEWWWQYRVHRWRPTGYVDATIYDYSNSPDFVHDVYSQSAYFMRDLRAQMGEANFNNFLRAYYQQFRNQTVTTNDFFELAQTYAGVDLSPLVGRYFANLPAALSANEP